MGKAALALRESATAGVGGAIDSGGVPEARRRYRIAFIGGRGVGHTYSGIETCYAEMGSRLAARGHEVTVYCRPYFAPPGHLYRGMKIQRLPAPRSKHFETLIHSFLSTVHSAWCPYDIVHIHAIGSSVFAPIPRLARHRTVVTVHARDWQRPKWNAIARACLLAAEWASVRLPHRTTTVSASVAAELGRRYGRTVDVIPNGVLALPSSDTTLLERVQLAPRRYVLFVGRLSEEKGCHLLIEAFQKSQRRDTVLVFAGGATYAPDYYERLRAMAGPDVRFIGWVDQAGLAALYANCALFVLPSRVEGLSVALLEAMSQGAPILASDIPPNVEALGDAGWVFRDGDVSDLEGHLSKLLADPGSLRRAGHRARQRAEECFGWEAVVDRVERVYDSLFTRHHGFASGSGAP